MRYNANGTERLTIKFEKIIDRYNTFEDRTDVDTIQVLHQDGNHLYNCYLEGDKYKVVLLKRHLNTTKCVELLLNIFGIKLSKKTIAYIVEGGLPYQMWFVERDKLFGVVQKSYSPFPVLAHHLEKGLESDEYFLSEDPLNERFIYNLAKIQFYLN